MASRWGDAWGVAWGGSWDVSTPAPAPATQQFYSGGYALPAVLDRAKHVRQQREALGILPRKVREVVQAAAQEVIETGHAPLLVLKQELRREAIPYEPDYLGALQRLLMLDEAWKKQQTRKRQRHEEALLVLM